MNILISYLAGTIFSLGLVISGMTNPHIVQGFLDIFGKWDDSLVYVMLGAVSLNLITFRFLLRRKPACDVGHHLPQKKEIDRNLVIGSALFGLGWGLIGICPGPGIVNLVTLNPNIIVFVLSLFAGMFLFKISPKFN